MGNWVRTGVWTRPREVEGWTFDAARGGLRGVYCASQNERGLSVRCGKMALLGAVEEARKLRNATSTSRLPAPTITTPAATAAAAAAAATHPPSWAQHWLCSSASQIPATCGGMVFPVHRRTYRKRPCVSPPLTGWPFWNALSHAAPTRACLFELKTNVLSRRLISCDGRNSTRSSPVSHFPFSWPCRTLNITDHAEHHRSRSRAGEHLSPLHTLSRGSALSTTQPGCAGRNAKPQPGLTVGSDATGRMFTTVYARNGVLE
jgi:hypothetical protein